MTVNFAMPLRHTFSVWSDNWQPTVAWLSMLELNLRRRGASSRPGTEFDRWDLELSYGSLASARLRLVAEEHGQGNQLVRFQIWPRLSVMAVTAAVVLAGLAVVGCTQRLGRALAEAPAAARRGAG